MKFRSKKQLKNSVLISYLKYFERPDKRNCYYIHIAGTKGKTSTSYYTYSLLLNMNLQAGLFVSPHVYSPYERIQCNGHYISEESYFKFKEQIQQAQGFLQQKLSFFCEWLLIAFLYFREQKCPYVILEVGIGGLYDCTNIIKPSLCVITTLGKDHQEVLGSWKFQITRQKMGIIKSKTPFIIGNQKLSYWVWIFLYMGSKIFFWHRKLAYSVSEQDLFNFKIKINQEAILLKGPSYMVRNFVLAYQLVNLLTVNSSKTNLQNFYHNVPGRFEVDVLDNKTFVYDGAHNALSISVLKQEISRISQLWTFILCIKQNKDIKSMLQIISPIIKTVVLIDFPELGSDFNNDKIVVLLEKEKIPFCQIHLSELIETIKKDKYISITGSFYHLKIIREFLYDI